MKAAWYERNGSARDVLTLGTLPDPTPGPGEVRVRIEASGVNPSDVKSRAGRPLAGARVVPHSDGAGTIDRIGEGVPHVRLGERVWIWNGQWKRSFGTAAEYCVLPAEQAVFLPGQLSFAEGACLGIPALTALRALTVDGGVVGKTVLVAGGAGAVGAYATQFARLLGAAEVIATVSSAQKAVFAASFGADYIINYRDEPVGERVREITGGRGVDRVIEVDAAANSPLWPEIVSRDGLAVIYGSGKPQISVDFLPMIMSGIALRFFIVYELAPDVRQSLLLALNGYLSSSLLTHHVTERFPLEKIAEAHEAVESGTMVGNVVIDL